MPIGSTQGLWSIPVLSGLLTLLVVVVLARVGGRLLGVRLGWGHALLAGFPGLILGIITVWAATGHRAHGPRNLPWLPVLFAALIATMLIAVLLELMARPGRFAAIEDRFRNGPFPHPWRALQQRLSRTRRYVTVSRIVTRNGLSAYLSGRRPDGTETRPLARNARRALEEAGGMFVKLGQVLSTRSDLLPADVIAELSGLQDHVRAASPETVQELLAEELGAPADEYFKFFDPQPIAAASIAQAHRAQLATGEQVVVKVQRPRIRALVDTDLDILLGFARTLHVRAPWARDFGVLEMADGFAAALREELDFRIEARNIAAVTAAGSAGIKIPVVYMATARVLVLEWLDGVNVRESGARLADCDRLGLARGLLNTMLRQMMVDGTFHADPHPGNVLVLRDGALALIDFGSVGRLDPLQQAALRRLVLAVARRNATELHDALLELASARKPASEDTLERALAQFMAQHLGPGMVPDASMLNSLFRLLSSFGLVFQPVVAGVFRAMMTLEGTLILLSPGFDMAAETRDLAGSWLGQMFSPSSLREAATDEALGLLPVLRKLPRRLDRIAASLEHGDITASMRVLANESDRRFVSAMVGRAVLAFLGATLGIMSVMLIGTHGGPTFFPGTSLFHMLGYVGLFFSTVLILRVVLAISREGI